MATIANPPAGNFSRKLNNWKQLLPSEEENGKEFFRFRFSHRSLAQKQPPPLETTNLQAIKKREVEKGGHEMGSKRKQGLAKNC
jgi:hypothetical protein